MLLSLYGLLLVAEAQDAPEPVPDQPIRHSSPELEAEIKRLLENQKKLSISEEGTRHILKQTKILLDDRHNNAKRISAAQALSLTQNPSVLPLLRAAIRSSPPPIRMASLKAASRFPDAETSAIGQMILSGYYSDRLKKEAVLVLGNIQRDDAAEVLWMAAISPSLSPSLQTQIRQTLETSYGEWLKKKGPPPQANDPVGRGLFVAGSTITSSVTLGSIGVWGGSDIGPPIGYIGGGGVGLASSWLYSSRHPTTSGQGALYLSNTLWGLAAGNMISNIAQTSENGTAALQTLGSLAGSSYGWYRLQDNIEVGDVLEFDLSGYLGLQLGGALPGLMPDQPSQSARSTGQLVGTTLGLAMAHPLSQSWKLDWNNTLFSSVFALEGAIFTSYAIPNSATSEQENSLMILGSHTAFAGAMLYNHYHPPTLTQSAVSTYGLISGNLLGSGVPLLTNASWDEAWTTMPLGVLGVSAGAIPGKHHQWTKGDLAMNGIGIPMLLWHSAAIGEILHAKDIWQNSDQALGLVLTSTGAGAVALATGAAMTDPDPADMIFLGSANAWGAIYGALLPIAIKADLPSEDALLISLVGSDVTAILGAWGIRTKKIESRRTAIPQITAMGVGTISAIGVLLFTNDSAILSASSLVGTTTGFVGGYFLDRALANKPGSAMLWKPHFASSRQWRVQPTDFGEERYGLRLTIQ